MHLYTVLFKQFHMHYMEIKELNDCFFFIPDFYCDKEKLIIEMDGGIHDDSIEKDIHRDQILQNLGFCVLHIRNEELPDIELVLSKIQRNFR